MCHLLEQKMKEKNISFEKCNDVERMHELGITHVPMLQKDNGEMIGLAEALAYIAQEGQSNGVH